MVNWRFKLCLLLIFVVFLLITYRLFYWQVLKREELVIKAENQRNYRQKIPAIRGEILTFDKYPLAINKTSYLVYASLKEIKEKPPKIAEKLADILVEEDKVLPSDLTASISAYKRETKSYQEKLKEKKADLIEKLSNKKLVWISLEPKVSQEKKELIENLNFSGIGFEPISDRGYPEASTAAHLLGFLGKDSAGTDTGYFGLEGFYNRELVGQEGGIFGEKDVFGIPILIGRFFKRNPRAGHSLFLNLDLGIQKIIEKDLKQGILKYEASGGTIIVLNPQNGAIIAMSSYPIYEPQDWQNFSESSYRNPAIAEIYEPGSIIKPLVMAAAINEKKVKPETRCDKCNGPREISGHLIRTFNNQYHPNLTMTEVLENSDNTGMIYVGEKLGFKKVYYYLQQYGFGQLTGVDLQEENTGDLRPEAQWYDLDKATVNFGQGIAVTSLQMVQAWATLANGGKLLQPQVVSKIKTSDDQVIEIKPKFKRQVLKPATVKVITEMLVSTCEKSPLHFYRDKIPELKNYRIAAKSGTAQVAIAGRYQEGITIGSVIGFAPADNPQFLIFIKLNEPQANPWGANTAGPIFFNLMKELLIYYGISP